MQGHPVEFLLPVFPFPVRHGVAESADIHVLSQHEGSGDKFKRLVRKLFREDDIVDCPGGDAIVIRCDIVIETTADCHGGTSLHGKFAFLHFCGKVFAALHRAGNYKFHIGRFPSESPGNHSRRRFLSCLEVFFLKRRSGDA